MPSATSDATPSGKRVFSSAASSKLNGSAGQKIKNFFRISSKTHDNTLLGSEKGSLNGDNSLEEGTRTPPSHKDKNSLRHSRFLPHIGRSRSTTVASEGNTLEDGLSPIAHANPYFQHQGPPALRHHDDTSIPPSPPDTPEMTKKTSPGNAGKDANGTSGKEELARKLRRVASAPNAQGLFKGKGGNADSRPQTAEFEATPPTPKINGLGQHNNASALSMVETIPQDEDLLPVPSINGPITPGKLRNSIAFRRTYSSNSIKVRNVEVGPGSFDKIKLIGKGDVGKVYLVREKKSTRLFAMKGKQLKRDRMQPLTHVQYCRRKK